MLKIRPDMCFTVPRYVQWRTATTTLAVPEHVVGFWCFVSHIFRFLVMPIRASLTDSAPHHQADVEGGDQVFTDLQGRSCKLQSCVWYAGLIRDVHLVIWLDRFPTGPNDASASKCTDLCADITGGRHS